MNSYTELDETLEHVNIESIVAEGFRLGTMRQNVAKMKLIATNPERNELIRTYERHIDMLAEFQSLQITLTMWLSELGSFFLIQTGI